jgi:hypothetical protein
LACVKFRFVSSPLCGVRTPNAQYSVNGILSVLCGHLNEVFERLLRDNPHSAQAARDVSVSLNKLGAFLDGCGIRRRSSFSMIGKGEGGAGTVIFRAAICTVGWMRCFSHRSETALPSTRRSRRIATLCAGLKKSSVITRSSRLVLSGLG